MSNSSLFVNKRLFFLKAALTAMLGLSTLLVSFAPLCAQESIDTRSGQLTLVTTDLVLPAGGIDLEVRRSLMHDKDSIGLLGSKWRLNWESRLFRSGPLVVIDEASGTKSFSQDSSRPEKFIGFRGEWVVFNKNGSTTRGKPNGTKESFDKLGRLIERDLRNSNKITLHYGSNGLLSRVEGPGGSSLQFDANEQGRVFRIQASNGTSVRYDYSKEGLSGVQGDGGVFTGYTYDKNGRTASIDNPQTGRVEFSYDSKGRVVSRRWADGNQERYEYNDQANRVRTIDATGAITTIQRSRDGRREEITDVSGQTFVREFSDTGQLLGTTGPSGQKTRFAYDDLGRLILVKDGKGITRFEYLEGLLLTRAVIHSDGTRQLFEYDRQYNLTSIKIGSDSVKEINYTPDGLVKNLRYANGYERFLTYYPNGLLETESDSRGAYTKFEYDMRGNIIRKIEGTEIDGSGSITQRSYDEQGHVKTVKDATGAETRYEYTSGGLLAKVIDPEGGVTSYKHDVRGRLIALTNPLGSTTRYEYDAGGRIKAVTDAIGGGLRFEYDKKGNLVREIDAAGHLIKRSYDAQSRIIEQTDRAGATTRFEYDQDGFLRRRIGPMGGVIEYKYGEQGDLTSVVDSMGRETRLVCAPRCSVRNIIDPAGTKLASFEYDERGNLTHQVNALDGFTKWTYDRQDRILELTEVAGGITRYEYSTGGKLIRLTEPSGIITHYKYDLLGRLKEQTDNLGSTRYEYNSLGDITKITLPNGRVKRFEYDAAQNLTLESDPDGSIMQYEYDPLGRMIQLVEPTGLETNLQYDAVGNLLAWNDSLGGGSTFSYDANGRITSITDASNATTRYSYNAAGNLIQILNPLGQVKRISYNLEGQITSVVEASKDTTAYEYDHTGRLNTIHDPVKGKTHYAYDRMGNPTQITNPMGIQFRRTYNAAGRLTSLTDAEGRTTTYTYDVAGRLREKRLADGKVVTYEYNKAGDLIRAHDSIFPVEYDYNRKGELVRIKYPAINKTLAYEYDAKGLRSRLIDAEGRPVVYTYDQAQRLTVLKLADGKNINLSYDKKNRLVSVDYPNRHTARWTYDTTGRPKSLSHKDASGQVVEGWRYFYDKAGNRIKTITATGQHVQYAYDSLGQLVEEVEGQHRKTLYRYLPGGNRTEKKQGSNVVRYRYDLAGRLITADKEFFKYDGNGNLVECRGPRGITRYSYDAENLLVKVVGPEGYEVSFGYGPMGNRIWRRDAAGLTYFLYDGSNLVAELGEDLRPRATYIHGSGIDRPLVMTRGGERFFYHADMLGNITHLTDEKGNIEVSYGYDAFGAVKSQGSQIANPFLFTGREYERSIGLYFFRARYYDPNLGRFLSVDPEPGYLTDPLSLNPYQYAFNNPLRFVDPLGTSAHERKQTSGTSDGAIWERATGHLSNPFSGRVKPPPTPYDVPTSGFSVEPTSHPDTVPGNTEVYGTYNAKTNKIKIFPEAGPRGEARFSGSVLHEFRHFRDKLLAVAKLARAKGLDPNNLSKSTTDSLVDELLRDPNFRPKVERMAIAKETIHYVRDLGLPVDHPEVKRALKYYELFGDSRQLAKLKKALLHHERAAANRSTARWGSNVMTSVFTAAQIASCLDLGGTMGQCAIQAGLSAAMGAALMKMAAAAGISPTALVLAAGAYGWYQVGLETSAQWEDYQRRQEAYTGLEEARKKNMASIDATLNALKAKLKAQESSWLVMRNEIVRARNGAKKQALDAKVAAKEATDLLRTLNSYASQLDSASKECNNAESLTSQLNSYATDAQNHADEVSSKLQRGLEKAMQCQTKKEAKAISQIYQDARIMSLKVSLEVGQAKNAYDSLKKIMVRAETAKADKIKVSSIVTSIESLASKANVAFETTGNEIARAVELFATLRASVNAFFRQIRTIDLVFPNDPDVQREFSILLGRVDGGAQVSSEDLSGLIVLAQDDAARAAGIATEAKTVLSKISRLTFCDDLASPKDVLKRVDAAKTLTDLSLTLGAELPQKASDCLAKAQNGADSKDDDLAQAMADLQDDPGGSGPDRDTGGGSTIDPNDLASAFTNAPATSQLGERETTPTIGRDPDREDVSDLEVQAREKEARKREEEARKTQAKKQEEEDYDRKWTGIIQGMADLRRQQDEINLEKLKGKQKEGEQLLDAARQRTGGMLSDSDFQDRLDKMQSEFDADKKALDEQIARNRRSSGPIECARDFTYDGLFNFDCNCDDYVFDFSRGLCVPNKTPAGTGPIVRRTPDKSGLSDVTVNITPTTLTVWDHGTEDLDRVNIFLNRQPVRSNLTLRNARQNITLYLRPGKNTLEVEALNIGDPEIQKQKKLPPGNAAAVEIQGVVSGKTRQKWILMTGDVGSMQIYYQP